MSKLGPNVKSHVTKSQRAALHQVMTALGAAPAGSTDRFEKFDLGGTSIGFEIVDDARAWSTEEARAKGTWLEIVVADPAATRDKLAELGVTPFEFVDPSHDYFQLPGGQVFRTAAEG